MREDKLSPQGACKLIGKNNFLKEEKKEGRGDVKRKEKKKLKPGV